MRYLIPSCFALLTASACASSGGVAAPAAPTEAPHDMLDVGASKNRGAGPDANVKRELGANSNAGDNTIVQPPSKGGPQARGALCYLSVSNNTRWYVQLYISGSFIGTMGPWADYSTTVTEGSGTLYGKAPFDDGTYSWWGPQSYGCHGQGINWTMHD